MFHWTVCLVWTPTECSSRKIKGHRAFQYSVIDKTLTPSSKSFHEERFHMIHVLRLCYKFLTHVEWFEAFMLKIKTVTKLVNRLPTRTDHNWEYIGAFSKLYGIQTICVALDKSSLVRDTHKSRLNSYYQLQAHVHIHVHAIGQVILHSPFVHYWRRRTFLY